MGAYFSRSRRMGTKTWLIVTILGFATISNASLPAPELSGSIRSITRNPRLFYVSTTTSTSFATTRCYIGSAAGTCPNTGRKKRNLVSDELERLHIILYIKILLKIPFIILQPIGGQGRRRNFRAG